MLYEYNNLTSNHHQPIDYDSILYQQESSAQPRHQPGQMEALVPGVPPAGPLGGASIRVILDSTRFIRHSGYISAGSSSPALSSPFHKPSRFSPISAIGSKIRGSYPPPTDDWTRRFSAIRFLSPALKIPTHPDLVFPIGCAESWLTYRPTIRGTRFGKHSTGRRTARRKAPGRPYRIWRPSTCSTSRRLPLSSPRR